MRGFAGLALRFWPVRVASTREEPRHTADKPAAPAKVEGSPKEADLATVTLDPRRRDAARASSRPRSSASLSRTTIYARRGDDPFGPAHGGHVAVRRHAQGPRPARAGRTTPGAAVKEGQPIFVLVPILSPESQATMAPLLIESEGQVKQTTENLQIAKVALDRAEKLVNSQAASAAMLVDARANYDLAQTNLRAAERGARASPRCRRTPKRAT